VAVNVDRLERERAALGRPFCVRRSAR